MQNKTKRRATSGMEWNAMLGLTQQLRKDGLYRDNLLVTCGCFFGLRISDLLALRWDDVLDQDQFEVLEGKTKKSRVITINDSVKEVIDFCYKNQKLADGVYLFENRFGGKLSVSYVNKRLKYLFAKYKIKVANPSSHTLRKTFGKRVFEMDNQSERSLVYLSQIFSHSSTSVTRLYIGITQEKIADVYMNL